MEKRSQRKEGKQMTKTENNILLISITLCWASSYIFIKNLPEDFSSYAYLTLTCGIAALLMALIFAKQLRKLRKNTWIKGGILSIILSVNLLTEKKGISLLAPSNASFLAALTIIIVPLLMLFFRQKPSKNLMLGACIIVLGLCISTGFTISGFYSTGTFYMLATCIGSAVYTIAVDRYVKEEDPLLICIVQMIFSTVIGFIFWYMENPKTFASILYTRELLSNIFILAFFAKAYAYIVLMFSQKYTDAVSVTVIAATEPVITLGLSILLPASYGGGQGVSSSSVMGAVVIAAGAVVAGLHFLERREKNHEV